MSLVIIDTKSANLSSVLFAIKRLGAEATITQDPDVIKSAERVILPGVGAAPRAMAALGSAELIDPIKALTQPVLGICLGMQILFENLQEGSSPIAGLGLIQGDIELLDTQGGPSPHMGWNVLKRLKPHPLLEGIETGDYAYFVHSYAARPSEHTLLETDYGQAFSACVAHNNIMGCQFHPERSHKVGAKILENFLAL